HVYEEDLPRLHALPRPIAWSVRLKSNPNAAPFEKGTITSIGPTIDPVQHTALVMGEVDNSKGELRIGQFVTATVELPPDPQEVETPTTALVEDGRDSVVFIQPAPKATTYVMRRVTVTRREDKVVGIRQWREAEAGLKPGERVVSSGALELKAALEDLQS